MSSIRIALGALSALLLAIVACTQGLAVRVPVTTRESA